jgi:uncharacterized iron-regulated membrane protein
MAGNVKIGHQMASKRLVRRKLWLKIHLWLGLCVGAAWVIVGLTGSINVFRWDIDEWLNPKLIVANPRATTQSLDSILETLHAAHPERTGTWSLEMPRHHAGMIMARHFQTQSNGDMKLLFVSVNPYTAEIVANRYYSDFNFLVTWIYELHSTFFLGEAGSYLAGVFGLLLMISLVIGVYLWWPRTGKFRQALTLKRHASPERLNYDIHKLFGIYGFFVLLIIAFSGTYMVFHDYVKPVVAWFSPVNGGFNPQPQPPAELKSRSSAGLKPISIEKAITIAKNIFSEAEIRFVKTPADTNGFYGVQMRQPHEASLFFTTTSVWIDQYSGKVLAVRNPCQFTAGETFLNLMWPIHNGEVLGLVGRILVCITGCIPLIMYITGIVRWLQKRS